MSFEIAMVHICHMYILLTDNMLLTGNITYIYYLVIKFYRIIAVNIILYIYIYILFRDKSLSTYT
jgi:hypothetical protein